MTTKTCFKCLSEKPLEAFYKHSMMADGHLNKCKECTKKDTAKRALEKWEYVRQYDRMRGSMPHRVAARKEYAKTKAYAESHAASIKKWEAKHPERKRASTAVGNAVRDGRLKKLPCLVCGDENVDGHHPDYSRPLDVVWLCRTHHSEAHEIARIQKPAPTSIQH